MLTTKMRVFSWRQWILVEFPGAAHGSAAMHAGVAQDARLAPAVAKYGKIPFEDCGAFRLVWVPVFAANHRIPESDVHGSGRSSAEWPFVG
jgi:hypothetical protein